MFEEKNKSLYYGNINSGFNVNSFEDSGLFEEIAHYFFIFLTRGLKMRDRVFSNLFNQIGNDFPRKPRFFLLFVRSKSKYAAVQTLA